jgi:hypothetical protein
MNKNEAIDIAIKELETIIASLIKVSFEHSLLGQWARNKCMKYQIAVAILESLKDVK